MTISFSTLYINCETLKAKLKTNEGSSVIKIINNHYYYLRVNFCVRITPTKVRVKKLVYSTQL